MIHRNRCSRDAAVAFSIILFSLVSGCQLFQATQRKEASPAKVLQPTKIESAVKPGDRPGDGKPESAGNDQKRDETDRALTDRILRHHNRGLAYLEQYNFASAAEEFRKLLDLKQDSHIAAVNLGIAYYYLVEAARARKQFESALQRTPGEPHAHFMLGLIARKENRNDEATRHFNQVLAVHPDDPATHYNLGLIFARAKDYQKAIMHFEKVLQAEAHNVSALYNLATALARSGRQGEARRVIEKFEELKGQDQSSAPMGQQYMEEGRFAQAINQYESAGADTQNARPKVKFVDVTSAAGIDFVHGGPGGSTGASSLPRRVSAAEYSQHWAEQNLVAAFGSGAAFLDYNRDGLLDIYIVNCSSDRNRSGNKLYRNNGDGTFTDVTNEAGVGGIGMGMGVAVGDYNNDGYPDIYVTSYGRNTLYLNDRNGKFTDVTEQAGVGGAQGKWSLSAAFFDYDHDGDLDLYVTNFVDLNSVPTKEYFTFPDEFSGQANTLYRNNGNGTFTDVTRQAGVGGGRSKSTSVIFGDYDDSRAIDFYVVNYGSPNNLYRNNRDGTFTDEARRVGAAATGGAMGAAWGHFTGNPYPDLFLSPPGGESRGLLLRNKDGRSFSENRIGTKSQQADPSGHSLTWGTFAFDFDNDGHLDVLLVGDGCRLLRGLGDRRFVDVSEEVGLSAFQHSEFRSAALGDYDGDGDIDLLLIRNGGRALLLRNDGGNRNHYVKLNLAGAHDNKAGIGAKVEIRSGGMWQKAEVTGNCGYLTQGGAEIILGLGERSRADSIRILWPSGVLQAELEPAANRVVRLEEIDRKGTSCPILYAWNGSRYEFVTDFLGGSAVGYLLAPGEYNTPDTDEYIKIPSSQLKARDGFYSIKMNNQLEEVIFIDEVKLLAVDHPAGVDVYPNERLMPCPPFPEFKIHTVKNPRLPRSAVDDAGNDLLPSIRYIDRTYADGFELLPFKGYAKEHSIVLDLGDLSSAKKILLLLTGWIDYADSSSNLAASQAGIKLIPPYVQVRNQQGEWVTSVENMGFPAGLPKTMTVDLTGKFSTPDYRVKITTNMRIYWDQILLDTFSEPVPLKVTKLDAAEGRLTWYGYPREYSPDGRKPFLYEYRERERSASWKSHLGIYTRYGDVRPLIQARDDMYVIMHHGDEITAGFDAQKLPPPPPGWARSFLVYAAGFGKDMDLNSAYSDTVGPLPFRAMSGYPYGNLEQYPSDKEHQQYLRTYNTRRIQDPLDFAQSPKRRSTAMRECKKLLASVSGR